MFRDAVIGTNMTTISLIVALAVAISSDRGLDTPEEVSEVCRSLILSARPLVNAGLEIDWITLLSSQNPELADMSTIELVRNELGDWLSGALDSMNQIEDHQHKAAHKLWSSLVGLYSLMSTEMRRARVGEIYKVSLGFQGIIEDAARVATCDPNDFDQIDAVILSSIRRNARA